MTRVAAALAAGIAAATAGGAIGASAGCSHRGNRAVHRDAAAGAGSGDAPAAAITLPPAPPVPLPPGGLPALPASPALAAVTPDQVALGELLFWDGRLAIDGRTSCASCHDPATDYSGGVDTTAGRERNRRRTQSLGNLAWASEFGWDGRFTSLDELMRAHVRGQLGQQSLDAAMAPLAPLPVYAAHVARVGGTPGEAALRALEAYALTRYDGDAPWDRQERAIEHAANGAPTDPVIAGYLLFTGKAQCAVCHTPPLYTDPGYHRLDAAPAPGDDGRGAIDPKRHGAFATPSLRGAALRTSFLHDGRATTLEQALDAHGAFARGAGPTVGPASSGAGATAGPASSGAVAGSASSGAVAGPASSGAAAGASSGNGAGAVAGGTSSGAGSAADEPALRGPPLTADERAHVLAFVRALTAPPRPPAKPALP